jgi:hypothetical protein
MVTWLRATQIQALFDKVFGLEVGKNDCRKSSGGPNQEKSGIIYGSLAAFLRNSKPASICLVSVIQESDVREKKVQFGGSWLSRFDSVVWVTINVSIYYVG